MSFNIDDLPLTRLRKSEDFRAVENCLIGCKSQSDCDLPLANIDFIDGLNALNNIDGLLSDFELIEKFDKYDKYKKKQDGGNKVKPLTYGYSDKGHFSKLPQLPLSYNLHIKSTNNLPPLPPFFNK